MRSALDAWLLSGGVGGDVCDVAHVQGGILRVSRGRGVARLVIGVVILRGVVGPAKREYRLLEAGLRAVARATQEIEGVDDVGGLGFDISVVARGQGLAGCGGGDSDVWDTHGSVGILRGNGRGLVLFVVVLVGLFGRVVGPANKG